MSEITDFHRLPGPTSDIGRCTELVHGFPADPEVLGTIVQGLPVRSCVVKIRGLQLSALELQPPADAVARWRGISADQPQIGGL